MSEADGEYKITVYHRGVTYILTYSTHIHNISVQTHKPLQIIKELTATGWGKQKETLMATYKAVMIPALEYAFSIMVASCILDQH